MKWPPWDGFSVSGVRNTGCRYPISSGRPLSSSVSKTNLYTGDEMNRYECIEALSNELYRPVSAGLDTTWLLEYQRAVNSKDERKRESALLLPGESKTGYSVYIISFTSGHGYVGMTKDYIVTRLRYHFADPSCPDSHWKHGTEAIINMAQAASPYHVHCVASGLSQKEAQRLQRVYLGLQDKPLNNGAGESFPDHSK